MDVVETVRDGLKRELKVTVRKKDLADRLMARLEELKHQVNLKGFRKGKVPKSLLQKMYGKSTMAQIVNDLVNKQTGKILVDRGEKAAQPPEVTMTEDEKEAEAVLDGKSDFEFTLEYEVLPEITPPDITKLKIERPITEISDEEVNERAETIAESARPYSEKKGKAAKKDRVTIDFVGKIDGEAFEGGAATDSKLILGSNSFIPGFEDQLIGAKSGEDVAVKVAFPQDYQATDLAGKDAVFDVTVKLVEKPGKLELNDEVAKQLGVESLEKMLEAIRSQLESQYGSFTRAKVKRQLLDELDKLVDLELPMKMVGQEFENIWSQVTQDMERHSRSFEDEETTEEKAREEYQSLAERRVRLGLTLGVIGEGASVEVTEEELQKAIYDQVRQYPGQEQEVMEYFRNHPDAVAGLRAPIYEDKVIDYIVSQAQVTDKTVSKEELTKEEDE